MFLKIKKFIKEPTRFLKDIRLFHNFFYKELNENEIFEYLDSNIDKPKLILCYFAEWKKSFITDFLPDYNLIYLKKKYWSAPTLKWLLNQGHNVLIWGYLEPQYITSNPKYKNQITRCEDGFIRSTGLGCLHKPPITLTLDKNGLYYNCKSENDLKNLILNTKLNKASCLKIRKLIDEFQDKGLSKYNHSPKVDLIKKLNLSSANNILVIEQVDKDMSIKYGCKNKITSLDLLERVSKTYPNKCILYKVHPDNIEKKNRHKNLNKIKKFTNVKLIDFNVMPKSIFDVVDEVHTITSLMGFEAALHSKKVTCYGSPFYSGWGVTKDLESDFKANKKIEEVFYAAYCKYPIYLNEKKLSNEDLTLAEYVKKLNKIDIELSE
jgi:capsular polysaccharide export protein